MARLKPAWNRLADDSPLRRWEWADAWWRQFGPGAELFTIAAVGDSGEVMGLVPFYRRRNWWSGQVLRPLGFGEAGLDHAAVLALPVWERPVAEATASWLARQARQRWDTIEWSRLETRHAASFWFLQACEQVGLAIQREAGEVRWRIALCPTWKAYRSWLPPSTQRDVRDLETRWLKTGRGVFHAADTPGGVEEGLALLLRMARQQRRGETLPTKRWSVRFQTFLYDVARRLDKSGRLRLCWLICDGRPVGVWCGVADEETLYSYGVGFEPSPHEAAWETLLQAQVLRKAIGEGIRYVDLGYIGEEQALAWRGEPQTVTHVRIAPPHGTAGWRDRLGQVARGMADWTRHWLGADETPRSDHQPSSFDELAA